jgi:hypothetical protein
LPAASRRIEDQRGAESIITRSGCRESPGADRGQFPRSGRQRGCPSILTETGILRDTSRPRSRA